jgi:hypothetical protein
MRCYRTVSAVGPYWAFTKVVRLKTYGAKRFVIVHEQEELQDSPRFLLTDAKHWESTRIIETWSYRWTAAVFHEFDRQVCGMEAVQVRKEDAGIRHGWLSGVAQSLIQRAPVVASKSERCMFVEGHITFGQQCRARGREVLRATLALCQRSFAEGKICDQVLELPDASVSERRHQLSMLINFPSRDRYGNTSPDLAETVSKNADAVLAKARGESESTWNQQRAISRSL